MIKVKRLLMNVFLWSSITFVQASALDVKSMNDDLSKKELEQAINSVIVILKQDYIFPKKALLIENKLKAKLAVNEFDNIHTWYSFIREINTVIRNISGDMYLDLVETKPQISLEKVQNKSELDSKEGFGINNVSILSGNVGYFKLDYFYQNPKAEIAVSRTLERLSKIDALIIDLRDAEGESLPLAQYLMSFFVEENTVLSEVLYDKQKKTKILRTLEVQGHEKFKHNFPVYILTSSFLSNSGEFFAYTLKHLQKAVVVGEESMGVAYILQKYKINSRISFTVPIAIPLHGETQMNWEKIGVIPDLTIDADLSLEAAHKMAKEYLGIF